MIVGHDGSTSTVNADAILGDETLIDTEQKSPLADVFAIYPSRLSRRTVIDDVREVRRELVAAVSGDPDSFDSFQLHESEQIAYAGITAEVFSVSEFSLEILSQIDD